MLRSGGVWAAPGWVGVEIFFVISGYVISRSAAGVTASQFAMRRALRLVPAAWICASLTALVLLGWSNVVTADVAIWWSWAILFLPRAHTIDPSYWTLELEVVFYLLVGLALRRGGACGAERTITALGVASALFLFGVGCVWAPGLLSLPLMRLTLMPHGVFFALGSLLAATHQRGGSRRGLALGVLLGGGALTEIVLHSSSMAEVIHGASGPWLPVLLFATATAAILGADRVQGPLARGLNDAWLARWSAATYPLYLLHQVIGSALIAAGVAAGLPAAPATALAIGGVVLLAVAVAEYAEPRLRASLRRVISGRRGPAPDTLPTASLPIG